MMLTGYKLLGHEVSLPMKLKLKLYFGKKKLMKLYFENKMFIESIGQLHLFWHLWQLERASSHVHHVQIP